jgi:hypothetical protein
VGHADAWADAAAAEERAPLVGWVGFAGQVDGSSPRRIKISEIRY